MSYTLGDLIALPAEFRDADTGTLTDPDTLALRVVSPDNTTNTFTFPGANVVRTSVGKFVGTVDGDQAGSYQYEWVLTGSLQGVEPGSFYVEPALPAAAAYRRVRGRLARLVAADMAPTLDDEDLDEILTKARRPDTACRVPSDAAWTPTWDLNAAAVEGWEIKAGRAAGDYDFAASGQRFNRSQVSEQCLKMADLYRRGVSGSAKVRSRTVEEYLEIKLLEGDLGEVM